MQIPEWVLSLPKEWAVVVVATLPVFELRGSIPLGVSFHLPLVKVYLFSLFGNLIPVIPLLLFFKLFFHKLADLKFIGKFFRWWFARVERHSESVRRWGFWGLVLFVSIPLPVTGAWTGTVAATLVNMNLKKAFLAILLGVCIAGCIVTLIVTGAIEVWSIFT